MHPGVKKKKEERKKKTLRVSHVVLSMSVRTVHEFIMHTSDTHIKHDHEQV